MNTDKPIRHFQRYTHEDRADRAASHRLGYRQKQAIGEVFWSHPAVPGIAFPTRKAAMRAANNNGRRDVSQALRDGVAPNLDGPGHIVAALQNSCTSMPKDGFLTGLLTFKEFASGDWPFKGRKTPKNPHDKGTPEHADWQRGYDAALVE